MPEVRICKVVVRLGPNDKKSLIRNKQVELQVRILRNIFADHLYLIGHRIRLKCQDLTNKLAKIIASIIKYFTGQSLRQYHSIWVFKDRTSITSDKRV